MCPGTHANHCRPYVSVMRAGPGGREADLLTLWRGREGLQTRRAVEVSESLKKPTVQHQLRHDK